MRRNFSRVLTLGDSLATITLTLTLTLTPAFCRVKVRPHKNLLFPKMELRNRHCKVENPAGRQCPASSSQPASAALRPPGPGRRPPLGRPVPLIASATLRAPQDVRACDCYTRA